MRPVSTWAWVAGFLALFLVTLIGLTIYLLISRGSSGSTVYAPDLVNVSYSVAQTDRPVAGLQLSVSATATNDGSQTDQTIVSQKSGIRRRDERGRHDLRRCRKRHGTVVVRT